MVLIVGPAWVGDMVMAQTLFKMVRQRQPQVAIDLLAPPRSLPLAARMPELRNAIALPLGHGKLGLATRFRLGRRLRGRYRQAILLPNSLKSTLVPFYAGIPVRTGFLGEWRWGLVNDRRPLDKKQLPRTVDRFAALGLNRGEPLPASLPWPHLSADPDRGMHRLRVMGFTAPFAPLLALCPGAEYGSAKQWPADHFRAVAAAMTQRGWRVMVVGSAKEAALGDHILGAVGDSGFNLAGRTRLEEAVDLLSLATVVVSNDSGLMHVAAALDRPLIALVGSSDPDHTPPMGSRAEVLSLGLSCAPCFKRHCPLGHLACLQEITPDRVIARIEVASGS